MKNILIGLLVLSFVQCSAQKKDLHKEILLGKERKIYGLRSVTLDKNIFIFGEYKNLLNNGINHIQSTYNYSYYLSMYDKNYFNKWLINIAECNTKLIYASITSDTNNCYVALIFSDSIKINGSVYLSNGQDDILVIKINKNGQVVYCNQIYSQTRDGFGNNAMQIDDNNNLLIVGYFGNSSNNNNTLHFNNDSLSGLNYNAFLLKIDSNGNFVFSKSFGNNKPIGFYDLYIENKDLYILGESLYPNINLDNIVINFPSDYSSKYFLIKLDSNGIVKWGRYFGMKTFSTPSLNSLIAKENNLYFVGRSSDNSQNKYFFQGGTFNGISGYLSGQNDYFLASYDTAGNFRWAKASQSNGSEAISQLAVDSNNNLLAVGYFDYTMAMGTDTLNTYGGDDAFVTSLDSNGNYLWSTSAGGAGVEVGNGIATTTDGEIYVVGGTSSNTCYFGQDAVQVDSLPSMFLAKIVNATPVGLQNFSKEDFWEVFPNPASTMLEIRCPMVGKKEIQLYNAVGQLVINLKTEHQTLNIETSKLPEGIYFLQLKQQGNTSTKKINIIY